MAFRRPDAFVDTFYGEDHVDEDELVAIIDELSDGTTELMCHPAHADTVLPTLSSYTDARYLECQTLTSDVVQEALVERDVELVASPVS